MSYNRGGNMRRDGGGGRRSNDFGGGGNRRSGGNYYDSYNSPMNPWEGGMVPGRSGSGGMMGSGQTDLLSQLTSPEAQLALASNLINKLINQQQQSVPSLMNLPNLGSGGMSSYNDNYSNSRNFQDRRRGRMDQRRVEPYNKSGMNRRMGTDRHNLGRNQNRPGSDRRTALSKSPKGQRDDKDKKDKQDAEKPNGDVKSELTDESKRDEEKDDRSEEEKKKGPKEKEPPLPPALLYCHVCGKNMWDEVSFNKHMKGRPHQLMMDGLSDKYKLKVDLLRHEMRLAEQQREMELERKQRQGMKMFPHPREYCAMCDLHFYGHLISHRKNVRHQKLKAFLHPKCSHCHKEFSTRLEWDDHRLSFSHLMKVAAFRRATKPDINDDEFDIDELVCPDNVNCGEMVSKEVPVLARHHSEEDISVEIKEEPLKERDDIKKESKDDDEKGEGEEKEKKDEIKEADYPQGIDTDPAKLPKYSPSVRIGKDLVVAVSGFVCRVCNRFIPSEEETQVHCRTLTHYNNYCNVVRAKARVTGRKKKALGKPKDGKEDEEKADDDKQDDEKADDNKTGTTEEKPLDNEGNWKRTPKVYEADESMEVDVSVKEESKDEITDSVWEEVDKDIETVMSEIQKDADEKNEEEEEEEDNSPKRTQRGGKVGRGRRGGRRGK